MINLRRIKQKKERKKDEDEVNIHLPQSRE